MLSPQDVDQIELSGISQEQVDNQIEQFKTGFKSIILTSPALIGDGIIQTDKASVEHYINIYDSKDVDVIKFVPASGAASRMFKFLFEFLVNPGESSEEIDKFNSNLSTLAFYDDLLDASSEKGVNPDEFKEMINLLLSTDGLNYGQLPKGLIKFHKYEDVARTPAEEHIIEGLSYANKMGQVSLHFTVSPDHKDLFENHIEEAIKTYSGGTKIECTFSVQKPSTNTVAVNLNNEPFRSNDGTLLFRPAGHGALIENLNDLDADIVFIKNIDNVVPDRLKGSTTIYKKVLAGILLNYQQKTFDLLRKFDGGQDMLEEGKLLLKEMGWKGTFSNSEVRELLDRPIRVCGMVKNEGEPGGGPFWVESENAKSLQIVESAQVDQSDGQQADLFKKGTHFNPVDLVCGIKNYKGKKFNLLDYRDPELGFITEKTHQGRKLRAMELPGLWNGSMAYWNTIFVEVPLVTFNPVKTANDLLKENHI